MSKTIDVLLPLSLATAASMAGANATQPSQTVFSPAKGIEAVVTVKGQEVHLALAGHSETIAIETEKPLRISIEDFNFDGHKDFSISHIDDGMGTYEISHIYAYAPKERKFLPVLPRCGDQFINLKVDRAQKMLINSYVRDNRYLTCKAKY